MRQLSCGGLKIHVRRCSRCVWYSSPIALDGLTGSARLALPVGRLGAGVCNSGSQCVTIHPAAAALAKPTLSGHKPRKSWGRDKGWLKPERSSGRPITPALSSRSETWQPCKCAWQPVEGGGHQPT